MHKINEAEGNYQNIKEGLHLRAEKVGIWLDKEQFYIQPTQEAVDSYKKIYDNISIELQASTELMGSVIDKAEMAVLNSIEKEQDLHDAQRDALVEVFGPTPENKIAFESITDNISKTSSLTKTIQEALGFYNSMISKDSIKDGKNANIIGFTEVPQRRATFNPVTRFSAANSVSMGIININEKSTADEAVHEMGHWLERNNPAIKEEAIAYLLERVGDNPVKSLPVSDGYGLDEHYQAGNFPEDYVGKVYLTGDVRQSSDFTYDNTKSPYSATVIKEPSKRESTELISMGMAYLYQDPQWFARKDPDYFQFMWRVLHT
jgi:hypothetical protein